MKGKLNLEYALAGSIWAALSVVGMRSCVLSDVSTMTDWEKKERHFAVYHRFGEDYWVRPWDELVMQEDHFLPLEGIDVMPYLQGDSLGDYFSALARLSRYRFAVEADITSKTIDPPFKADIPGSWGVEASLDHIAHLHNLHFDRIMDDHGPLMFVWKVRKD